MEKNMARLAGKNGWTLLIFLLSGIVLGGFLGYLAKDVSWLSWLNFGQEFGLGSPDGTGITSLNLGVVILSFGLRIKITIASILGMIISMIIYRKL
jgi:hypothetical protein